MMTDTIVLDENEYLSDKIDYLPCGIINKTETGIGATTVEFNAKRNSIIVEPLKVTASSKAFEHKDSLYVGSPTALHPNKINHKDIKNYIENSSIEYKKIVVVSDSLNKVIEVLKLVDKADFYLVIDESDSMQLDSNFRNAMETCYELYKAYPKDKRCMLTATQIQFNDPNLKDEPITNIVSKVPTTRTITLNHTDNILGTAIDIVKELHFKNPTEKIVIAYNNVTKLNDLAIDLEKALSLSSDDISILCGANSQKTAGKFYRELTGTTYPSYLNLKTSAYHTGFDIKERYHLITIVDSSDIYNSISESKIKQIAGRCRNKDGLYSENIVYNFSPITKINPIKLEDLIEAAEKEKKALNCLSDNFGTTKLLKDEILPLRKLITEQVKCLGYQLVKCNKVGDAEIAYLNIDAALETYRVYNEIYSDQNGLKNALEMTGNVILEKHKKSLTVVKSKTDYKLLIKERCERIDENLKRMSVIELKDLTYHTSDKIEKLSYEIYCDLVPYLKSSELMMRILNYANSRKATKLEMLKIQGIFSILEDKSRLKSLLASTFIIGEKYDKVEISKKTASIIKKMGLSKSIIEADACFKIFTLLCNSTRNTKSIPTTWKILDYNTAKITIEKYKKEDPNFSDFFTSLI